MRFSLGALEVKTSDELLCIVVQQLAETNEKLDTLNDAVKKSLEKGDALLALGAELKDIGATLHQAAGDLREALHAARGS